MKAPIRRQEWLLAGLGVVLVFFLLNSDLVAMKCIFKWDSWYLFWPMFYALASKVSAGLVPLWDTTACCGFPFHADPQTGTFYPVFWAVGWLLGAGFHVYQSLWLAHWLAGIVGFFFLVKRMGCSPAGAFVASVVFGFSGFFVGQASQTVCIFTMAYVPWVLLLMDRAADESLLYALPAGVLFGFTGLGGHPGMTIYAGLMIAVWCALKYGLSVRTVAIVSITFIVGGVVLSPAYGSFVLEGRDYTDRAGSLSLREATNLNRFPFSALVSLVAPGLTVAYPTLFDTTPDRMAMLNGYCGIFGLLAVLMTVFCEDLRKRWTWLLLFMVVAFLFALGSVGGLKVIAHYLVPPLRFVRHPSFVRVFWMLGAGILAGQVFDRLIGSERDERPALLSLATRLALGVLYVAVSALLWAWLATDQAIVTEPQFADIRSQPNSLALALEHIWPQLTIIILFIAGVLLLRTSLRRAWITGLLILLVVLDAAAHLHTNKYTVCWNGKAARVSAEFEQVGQDNRGQNPDPNEPRLSKTVTFNWWAFDRQSYIRAYLAPKSSHYDTLVGSTWVPSRDTKFLKVLEGPLRFWLTPRVSYCEDSDKEVLSRLANTDNTGPVPVFLHCKTAESAGKGGFAVKPGTYGQVQVMRYEPESVLLSATAPDDCWLFATERFAAGWKAYVDEKEVELCRADFCFRALRVPQGSHVVRMSYEAWLWKPLLVISWGLSLLVLAIWGAAGLHRWRRRSEPGK